MPLHFLGFAFAFLTLGMYAWPAPLLASTDAQSPRSGAFHWQSEARLHDNFKRAKLGTLMMNEQAVEFRSPEFTHRWPYVEIQTFDLLSPERLTLISYENRGWHFPGERRFRFELSTPVPPDVAAEITRRVGKPVRNGDPDPRSPAFATIPARHPARFGGSNGTLRFREEGIDYVTTTSGDDGRSWRWADIQTLANPDPYTLRVAAFREIFDFKLKQPLPHRLFERLWDSVYGRDLRLSLLHGGNRP